MHAPQLEGVAFPGRRRARDAAEARAWGDGYTMQDFLEANVRTKPGRKGTAGERPPPEVFVCGGWRAGPAADAATGVAFAGVPGFRTLPAGVCERVVRARAFYKASLGRSARSSRGGPMTPAGCRRARIGTAGGRARGGGYSRGHGRGNSRGGGLCARG